MPVKKSNIIILGRNFFSKLFEVSSGRSLLSMTTRTTAEDAGLASLEPSAWAYDRLDSTIEHGVSVGYWIEIIEVARYPNRTVLIMHKHTLFKSIHYLYQL